MTLEVERRSPSQAQSGKHAHASSCSSEPCRSRPASRDPVVHLESPSTTRAKPSSLQHRKPPLQRLPAARARSSAAAKRQYRRVLGPDHGSTAAIHQSRLQSCSLPRRKPSLQRTNATLTTTTRASAEACAAHAAAPHAHRARNAAGAATVARSAAAHQTLTQHTHTHTHTLSLTLPVARTRTLLKHALPTAMRTRSSSTGQHTEVGKGLRRQSCLPLCQQANRKLLLPGTAPR